MTTDLLYLLGGIGLFLFGMQTMTEALRDLASSQARQVLAGFTRRPLSGAVTGALTTAAIQSSSATMVMAVGFVGAGLLTFPQALGILYGASVGTTVTGWMVLLVGFKLQLSAAALPVLFVAATVRVMAEGQWARLAMALAGLSLIFLGIDMMQQGMAGYEGRLTPGDFPPATPLGRLQLVGIGVLVTLITQSSSAGVAGVLVLLGAGSLTFAQGAALVIGMHVGTTFTALLAAVGGAHAVRQTAVANVLYHVATGIAAVFLVDVMAGLLRQGLFGGDAQLGLVTFHTGFNLIGTAAMLPLTDRFAALVRRLVPEPVEALPADRLDRQLLADPGAALDTVAAVLREMAADLFAGLAAAMASTGGGAALASARARIDRQLDTVQDFLVHLAIADDRGPLLVRYDAALQELDHLRRLHFRAGQGPRLRASLQEPMLRRHVRLFAAILDRHATAADDPARIARRLSRLEGRLGMREARVRHATLRHAPHLSGLTTAHVVRLSEALRWLRRSATHAARVVHYQTVAPGDLGAAIADPPAPPEPAQSPAAGAAD